MSYLTKSLATCLLATATLAWSLPAISQTEISATDALGREIVLKAPAERIVLPSVGSGIVVAVDGSPERLVGVGSVSSFASSLLGEVFPEAVDLPIISGTAGSSANVEAVVVLQPDLVVMTVASPYESFVNAGLPIALMEPHSVQGMQAAIALIADLIGKPERGRIINDWRSSVFDMLAQQGEGIADEDKVNVLGLLSLEGNSASVYGRGAPIHEVLEIAGVVNTAAHVEWGSGPVNLEEVLGQDPDMIIVIRPEDVAAVMEHPLLSTTTAVQNRRVYSIPTGTTLWTAIAPEAPLMWMWLAALAYPDLYDFDLHAEMREWFAFMLEGHELTSEQINQILRTDANRNSAGYQRLIAD